MAEAQALTESLMVESRRRAGRIDSYVDLIPARFYLSTEALQAHKPKSGHYDPAQYKPTSQLLVDIVKAEAAIAKEASAGSSSQAGAKKQKKKKEKSAVPEASSRGDLRKLLEQRIADLKEERRKKQSTLDKEKNAREESHKAKDGKDTSKRPAEKAKEAAQPVAKKQRVESPVLAPAAAPAVSAGDSDHDDEIVAGRLTFEPRLSELPFEVGVNRRGHKVRELRASLRKEEHKQRKLDDAEATGDRESVRNDLALDTALRRAKGEKVHDDVNRLRKVQKHMETKKSKGKEKWDKRVEVSTKAMEDKQARRKENMQMKRGKKHSAKAKEGRPGFEGKKEGYLNNKE